MEKKSKLSYMISLIVVSVLAAILLVSTIVLSVAYNRSKVKTVVGDYYDFYLTLGTMPTLYATLNAYKNQNPNTYMWFYRGNTISKEYSADFINYFSTQSSTNANSEVDYMEIRDKVREIVSTDSTAKFRLFCDDLRVRFIVDIFVAAGVDFEDLEVTLLSDGTGSYAVYSDITEDQYLAQPQEWQAIVDEYMANRSDTDFTKYNDDQAMELQSYAFYLSTFDNVTYWIQHPDYLINTNSQTLNAERYNMNIVKKDPKAIYNSLSDEVREEYQQVVLANALVDSDTLTTLEEAANYYNSQLQGRDKEVVLILGTSYNGLEHNQNYIDQTIAYYTPTLENETTVQFKGNQYTISSGETTVTVDGQEYTIGECSVYLFFKGHPAYPANAELEQYFEDNGIVMLPHRTPVETLFWMYDVKVGGYQSTSFLSCSEGQTEFFYGTPTTDALVQMMENGFFEGAHIFNETV